MTTERSLEPGNIEALAAATPAEGMVRKRRPALGLGRRCASNGVAASGGVNRVAVTGTCLSFAFLEALQSETQRPSRHSFGRCVALGCVWEGAGRKVSVRFLPSTFDTDFLGLLMQAMLAGVALALMVAVWTDQEELPISA